MIGTDQLRYEVRGETAFVTFDRPQARNAITWEMYDALYACCEEADADGNVHALVLRGAGGKAFVAGTDIRQFEEFASGEDGVIYEKRIERIIGRLETLRKPTVAVVEGYATGAGLALAGASDLRLCTPGAKFGMPIARTLGNCLSMENYARLVALLGVARTKEMLLAGKMFSAEEALGAGLVMEVVPEEELDGRVERLCATLRSHAPITMRVSKEAVRRLQSAGLPDGEDLVRECFGSEDFREGVSSFMEKRRPSWRGR